MFVSTKVFDGFSCVFRQWKAEGTHCRFLHGYGISFKVWFEGEPDKRNWVWDFGGMKRAKTEIDGMSAKMWMDYMFDHTMLVATDDPFLESFRRMDEAGVIQLREIVKQFTITFGGSKEDIVAVMEKFDGTLEEMYYFYAELKGIKNVSILESMPIKRRGRGRPPKNPLIQ